MFLPAHDGCYLGGLLKIHRQANLTGSITRLRFPHHTAKLFQVCGGN